MRTHDEERLMKSTIHAVWIAAAITAGVLATPAAHAEMSAEELAKLAQNPVGNLISLPFQNNTNLNFGPDKGTQNILNIQPVIPISCLARLARRPNITRERQFRSIPVGEFSC